MASSNGNAALDDPGIRFAANADQNFHTALRILQCLLALPTAILYIYDAADEAASAKASVYIPLIPMTSALLIGSPDRVLQY